MIENNEIVEVFEILKSLVFEDEQEILVSLWYSNYHDLHRRNELGILDEDKFEIGINKVKNNLLEFIKKNNLLI